MCDLSLCPWFSPLYPWWIPSVAEPLLNIWCVRLIVIWFQTAGHQGFLCPLTRLLCWSDQPPAAPHRKRNVEPDMWNNRNKILVSRLRELNGLISVRTEKGKAEVEGSYRLLKLSRPPLMKITTIWCFHALLHTLRLKQVVSVMSEGFCLVSKIHQWQKGEIQKER